MHEGGPASRGGLALNGVQIAHFQQGPLSYSSLAVLPPGGTRFGPSAFEDGAAWVASCHWPHEERVRWQAVQTQAKLEHAPPCYEDSFIAAELEFVNKRWGSEFRFLAQYRLNISEERDRSEGRRIVRALMRGEDIAEKKGNEVEVKGTLGDYLLPDRGMNGRHVRDASAPRAPFF